MAATTTPKDALKQECQALKAAEIPCKLSPASSVNPFPLKLTIRVPQPDACHMFDVYEIIFTLTIESFDAYAAAFSVDPVSNGIDKRLAAAIAKTLTAFYAKNVKASWRLKELVAFVTREYRGLLMCVPGTLDNYMGEDAEGKSMRRFAPAFIKDTQEEEDEAEELRIQKEKEEEEAREYWRQQKLREEQEALEKARREAEEKRKEYESDPSLHQKPQQMSKKELEELHKSKQGVRMAKTGPNKKKFDPEAAAARKEARGEK
ncbi:UNVERIFIED_CONTAM: hypothetical protein HDU68_003505 [Siphonaria sp. JEL0065]|nr:hypothetical protein HDU68_003505 [Siphonaria sp. JEL0065]